MRTSAEMWELGDAALQRVAVGRLGAQVGVHEELALMADEMDVPVKTIWRYRGVAQAWPKKYRRKSVAFSVHDLLRPIPAPDRYELIRSRDWTVAQARAYVAGERKAK